MSNLTQTSQLNLASLEVNIDSITDIKITNLLLTNIDTEYAHNLTDGLKGVIIRARELSNLKCSFTVSESGSKYVTIPAGCNLTLDGLGFTGKTAYIQANKASTTVEIVEFY